MFAHQGWPAARIEGRRTRRMPSAGSRLRSDTSAEQQNEHVCLHAWVLPVWLRVLMSKSPFLSVAGRAGLMGSMASARLKSASLVVLTFSVPMGLGQLGGQEHGVGLRG